jgi:hypothetical protein
MSIKVQSALYAAELTVSESGCLSITVTPQAQYVVFSAQVVTATYLDICETLLKLWKEQQSIYAGHRRLT